MQDQLIKPCILCHHRAHQEDLGALQVHSGADFAASRGQYGVVWLRELHSGEQVRRDALEQREIVREELW